MTFERDRFWSIAKYFLIFFLPSFLLLSVVALVIYYSDVKTELRITEAEELRNVNIEKKVILNEFKSTVSDLMFIAEGELKKYFESGNANSQKHLAEELVLLSATRRMYDQIRFLNETGMEVLRINYNNGNPSIVPEEQLQSKKGRYYFQETFRLGQREVYVSAFDLNIEQGVVEKPIKPTIRFGTPVFDRLGRKRGIVLLNYLGTKLINDLKSLYVNTRGHVMIYNSKGFKLVGMNGEGEWRFMYENENDIARWDFIPLAGQQISEAESGQFLNPEGLFTFTTIHPFWEANKAVAGFNKTFELSADHLNHKGYHWKIISHVLPEGLSAGSNKLFSELLPLYAVLILMLAVGSRRLASLSVERKKTKAELRKLAIAIEQSPTSVLITDREGRIEYVNPKIIKLTGYTREELIGRNPRIFQSGEMSKDEYKVLWETIKSGNEWRGELSNKKKNGEIYWESVSISPIRDIKGHITNFIGVKEDITERRELEHREREKSLELKGIVKSLQTLVAELQLNVKQAKQLLGLVNGEQPRYIEAGDVTIFSHGIELSCNQEGGDHYFVHEISGNGNGDMGKTIISLKDQSGHSVSCILRSIMTDMFYQSLISENSHQPLEEILEALNKNMLDSKLLSDDEFFTSIDVEIDHQTLNMRYASGGHPPFIHIRGDKVSAFPEVGGDGHNPPLATFGSAGISVGELKLQRGDKLLFYTDGLTEATLKHSKDVISTDDLIGIVSRYAGLPVSEIQNKVIAEVSALSGELIDPGENENNTNDDITLIGVEIEDRGAYHEEVWQPQSSVELDCIYFSLLGRLLKEWRKRGFKGDPRLHYVLTESLVNAYKHGNREDKDKKMFIRWRWGNDLHFEVIDEGEGFDFANLPDPTSAENLEHECGRGISIIKHSASHVEWEDSGRHLKVTFRKDLSQSDGCIMRNVN